jgi:hypothetical protein
MHMRRGTDRARKISKSTELVITTSKGPGDRSRDRKIAKRPTDLTSSSWYEKAGSSIAIPIDRRERRDRH